MRCRFEWDPAGAERNLRKAWHCIGHAISVFDGDRAAREDDPEPDEERFRITGITSDGRVLRVIYIERSGDRIRVISARTATKHEVKRYRQG
jgi:uncharacterized DUF497 family protein